MIKPASNMLAYQWDGDIAPYLGSMSDVSGGFSPAKRGVVTLANGNKVFVKIAINELTKKWLQKEIKVYRILNDAGYGFAPKLLACSSDNTAMAITYLEGASFENIWNDDKVDAVMNAQAALKQYRHLFANDTDFKSNDVIEHDSKWPFILEPGNLEKLQTKLTKFGIDIQLQRDHIEQYAFDQLDWSMREDTLIHEDIRADNFGYDPISKSGLLIDWNWLCMGDESLDITPLFINMYLSGYDPYVKYPEKHDPQMLKYLMSFWMASILRGDEDLSDRELRLRIAQAKCMNACFELLKRS